MIFDCDGVLVDSERLVQDVDLRMIAELGWPITRSEILEQHLGRSEKEVTANIERVLGHPVPAGFARPVGAAYVTQFSKRLQEVPGVRLAVETLQQAGRATCVASSGSHARMALTLGLTGLRALFEGRVYSAEEVHRGKPAPTCSCWPRIGWGAPPWTASSSRRQPLRGSGGPVRWDALHRIRGHPRSGAAGR